MSVQVPIDGISRAAADYGPSAYVLVSSAEGPPRVTHSLVRFDGADILVTLGRRAIAALAANPAVSVLWPATDDQSMSLIADGLAFPADDSDAGEVRVAPTGAVRHRPASG
jgi:hypothetical protein